MKDHNMGTQAMIRSVNISGETGVIKAPVPEIHLDHLGIKGDAHAGPHHRQVSLLALESIHKYEKSTGSQVPMGGFGENITTEGLTLHQARPLDRFQCGELILELTQVGKKCHGKGCAIYKDTGECIMPDEGIFCRVLQGGQLKAGDRLEYLQKEYKLQVITLSDRAYTGQYSDRSGPLLLEEMEKWFRSRNLAYSAEAKVLPDEQEGLSEELAAAINQGYDFILTTGSTGLGSRDIAPETARRHIDKEIPGLMELIRVRYGQENPHAALSRSIAGAVGKSLLFVLPGSPRAVREYLEEIFKSLWHMVLMVNDIDSHS